MQTADIREHLEIVGADSQHVGTVDHVDGNSIKMTRTDPSADGQHHWIDLTYFDRVADDKVWLNVESSEANNLLSTEAA